MFRLARRGAALVAGALVLLGIAAARAEVPEVRIAIQFGLVYLPVAVAESEGYFASEAKKVASPISRSPCNASAARRR